MTYLTAVQVIVVNNNLFHYVNAALISLDAIANSTTWLTKVFDCLNDKRYLHYIFEMVIKEMQAIAKGF